MSDGRKDLPPPTSAGFLAAVREAMSTYLGKRGDPMDRGITVRDLADAGLIELTPGYGSRPGRPPVAGPGPDIGSGGTGGDVEPDLTPPPTPTGFDVTPTFNNLIIEHDTPVYTQGHGHGRTKVYGAQWVSGPLPTFTSAQEITQFVGNIFNHPTSLGTTWHLWIKWVTADGVESALPAGGTNGIARTTGKVGTSDLGPLIVEAGNLANGAVSAGKLAAGAVELTKFANGIEPVAVVSSVPGARVTQTVFNTADDKLYRWDGAAYVKSVDGGDITAGSIVAGKIAAGAIGANEIAAGAITTGKLLVTGQGAALNHDPAFQDSTAWWGFNGGSTFVTGLTNGAAGTTAFRSPANIPSDIFSLAVPVDPAKSYRVRCQSRRVGSNGTLYIGLRFWDGAGTNITGNGTFWYVGAVNSTPGTSWTLYQGIIGQGGPIGAVPANARSMAVIALVNYGGSAGYMELQDLRVEEAIGADLIVDGAIIATKLSANAIAVGSAAIQDGAIRNALIENLAVDSAKIANASVVTAKIGDLQVTTAKIANLAVDSAKIADAAITSAKIGDAQITTAKIGDAQITAAKVSSLNVGVISTAINGGSSGDRIEMVTNKIIVYGSGVNRVKIGDLS